MWSADARLLHSIFLSSDHQHPAIIYSIHIIMSETFNGALCSNLNVSMNTQMLSEQNKKVKFGFQPGQLAFKVNDRMKNVATEDMLTL